jgi:hypothetical protein
MWPGGCPEIVYNMGDKILESCTAFPVPKSLIEEYGIPFDRRDAYYHVGNDIMDIGYNPASGYYEVFDIERNAYHQ